MIAWAWDWLLWLAWYGLLVGGWLAWWRAHRKAAQLDHELTVMASSWRYATRKESDHV
jgi:hypothetical protein